MGSTVGKRVFAHIHPAEAIAILLEEYVQPVDRRGSWGRDLSG